MKESLDEIQAAVLTVWAIDSDECSFCGPKLQIIINSEIQHGWGRPIYEGERLRDANK